MTLASLSGQQPPAAIAIGRALAVGESGVTLQQRPECDLHPQHVRIQMRLGGLCRTDLYVADGELTVAPGRVLGHEACGVVVESQSARLPAGSRVVVDPLVRCRRCASCLAGEICSEPELLGVHHDGLFAEYVQLAPEQLHAVPSALDDRHAAFVEPAAAALAVGQAPIGLSQPGALLGEGRIASLTLRVLRSLGASDVTQLSTDSPAQHNRYHWCVETVANEATLAQAFSVVRAGGLVVWKSRPRAAVPIDLRRAVQKRLHIVAVDYAPFQEAIRWLIEHPQHDLLAPPLPWTSYREAFARARQDEHHKVLLSMPAPSSIVTTDREP